MLESNAEPAFKLAIEIFIAVCAVSVVLSAVWIFFGDHLRRKLKQFSERGQERRKQPVLRHDSTDSPAQGSTDDGHILLIDATKSDLFSPADPGTDYGSTDSTGGDVSGESSSSDSGGYEGGGDYGGGGSGGSWS